MLHPLPKNVFTYFHRASSRHWPSPLTRQDAAWITQGLLLTSSRMAKSQKKPGGLRLIIDRRDEIGKYILRKREAAMQHTNTSSMSGDSTTSLFCRDLGARWLTTRSEGYSNGWAKGLPGPNLDNLGSSRGLSFQGRVGNVAVCVPGSGPRVLGPRVRGAGAARRGPARRAHAAHCCPRSTAVY